MLREGSVLLVPRRGPVPKVVVDEVRRLAPARVVAIGGTDAVSQAALRAVAGGRRTGRIAGATRYDTAVAVARSTYRGTQPRVYLDNGAFTQPGALTSLGPVLPFPMEGHIPDALAVALAEFAPSEVVKIGAFWRDDRTPEILDLTPSLRAGAMLSPRLRLLLPEDLVGIAVRDGLPQTVGLTSTAAELRIAVGDLVTAGYHPTKAPAGLLARVTGVGPDARGVPSVLTVEPARVSDALVSLPSERRLTLWPVVAWTWPPTASMRVTGTAPRGLALNPREAATTFTTGELLVAPGTASGLVSIREQGQSSWQLPLSVRTPEGTARGRFTGTGRPVVAQTRIGLLPLVKVMTASVDLTAAVTPVAGSTAVSVGVSGVEEVQASWEPGGSTLTVTGSTGRALSHPRGPTVRVGRSTIDLSWTSVTHTRWYGVGGYATRQSARYVGHWDQRFGSCFGGGQEFDGEFTPLGFPVLGALPEGGALTFGAHLPAECQPPRRPWPWE